MNRFFGAVITMIALVVTGCASNSNSSSDNPPTPPAPPAASVAVTSPQNGAVVYKTPVTISISTKNVSDASQIAVLLGGIDISAKFGAADANGIRSAQISLPEVNYGKNQVQVRYQKLRVNSSFILDSQAPTLGDSSSLVDQSALLVGITTRVLKPGATGTEGTDWGIRLNTKSGPVNIWSNVPINQNNAQCGECSFGFQIVVLRRTDLGLVFNGSYETADPLEIARNSPFLNKLASLGYGPYDSIGPVTQAPLPECVQSGCILIMQSLAQIGYTPCWSSDQTVLGSCNWASNRNADVFNYAYWLTKLGASSSVLYANGGSPNVGYSFIGNVGTLPGQGVQSNDNGAIASGGNQNSQFERLGCTKTRYQNNANICDSLGRAGSADNTGGSTDIQQAGRIDGVLIRDNYALFTFSQSKRQIPYTFGTTYDQPSNIYTNVISIDGSTTEGAGQYTMKQSTPGFRLLILPDRTNPAAPRYSAVDRFYPCCNANSNGLNDLVSDLNNYPDANVLFFLASMGNIQHDNQDSSFAPIWDNFITNGIQRLGGDPLTAKILGDDYDYFDKDGKDDYLLVGKITAYAPPVGEQFTAGSQTRYTAQEAGYVLTRHTLGSAAPWPTQVEGVLVQDHQGYYTPHMQGFKSGIMVPQVTSVASASLLPPVPWPYGSTDTAATDAEKKAYSYISAQICCDDIRLTYDDLAVSPTAWVAQLNQIVFPSGQTDFEQEDFDNVRAQLAKEFGYVADVRSLNSNVLSLYQSEQSNVGLILTQAASDIKSEIDLESTPPPSSTPWSILTSDIFPVLTNLSLLAGPEGSVATQFGIAGVDNALGLGSLVIDNATEHSNDNSGVSQQMQSLSDENIAEADLAQHEVDQYVDSLATLGNDFKRVVTNWNSLRAVGAPIENGQLVWDPLATSTFLRGFDLTTRRHFFPLLMRDSTHFWITHIMYSDDHYYASDDDFTWSGGGCGISDFSKAQLYSYGNGYEKFKGTSWYPGVIQRPGHDGSHPGAYWRDIWALGSGITNTNEHCPNPNAHGGLPNTFGMFDPAAVGENSTTNGLGLWRPYVYQYVFTPKQNYNPYFSDVP